MNFKLKHRFKIEIKTLDRLDMSAIIHMLHDCISDQYPELELSNLRGVRISHRDYDNETSYDSVADFELNCPFDRRFDFFDITILINETDIVYFMSNSIVHTVVECSNETLSKSLLSRIVKGFEEIPVQFDLNEITSEMIMRHLDSEDSFILRKNPITDKTPTPTNSNQQNSSNDHSGTSKPFELKHDAKTIKTPLEANHNLIKNPDTKTFLRELMIGIIVAVFAFLLGHC